MSLPLKGAWMKLVCRQGKPQRRSHLQKMKNRRHQALPCEACTVDSVLVCCAASDGNVHDLHASGPYRPFAKSAGEGSASHCAG